MSLYYATSIEVLIKSLYLYFYVYNYYLWEVVLNFVFFFIKPLQANVMLLLSLYELLLCGYMR